MNFKRFKLRNRLGMNCDQFEAFILQRVRLANFKFTFSVNNSLMNPSGKNCDEAIYREERLIKEKARAKKYNVEIF